MLEKKINQKRDCRATRRLAMTSGKAGSALIMTVVLVVLLSIVAVMFVMVARMDSASTSNIVDSKTLDNAASSIIGIISKELVLDTPGVAAKINTANPGILPKATYPQYYDYQDYPDPCDAWLASIEPYGTGKAGIWRQISDVTGYLRENDIDTREIKVKPTGSDVIRDYPEIEVDSDGRLDIDYYKDTSHNDKANADADGDGIADSKWIELDGINTSKGKKVFAAIRIIDNCAMLNVNTAYKFDANTSTDTDRYKIDGTSQLQINLEGLLKTGDKIDAFHNARGGVDTETGWKDYKRDVIWDYNNVPVDPYLPFDISDELELRYRYCINNKFASRLETDTNGTICWGGIDKDKDLDKVYNTDTDWGLHDWQRRITDTNNTGDGDRRHLLTTYSFDRIIDPDGNKMFNVRSADSNAQSLYNRLVGESGDAGCIERLMPDTLVELKYVNWYLAQIAANIVDYSDDDPNVSVVEDSGGMGVFYGYEPPFMFISEVARYFNHSTNYPADPNVYCSYAVELYKNFDKSQTFETGDWILYVNGELKKELRSEDFNSQGGQYYVLFFEDGNAPIRGAIDYTDSPEDGAENISRNVILDWPVYRVTDPCTGNTYSATSYKLYMGLSEAYVASRPSGAINTTDTSYNPDLSVETFPDIPFTIYWCVDGYRTVDGNTFERPGDVWRFTVGDPGPEDAGERLLSLNSVELRRRTEKNVWIPADEVDWTLDSTGEDEFKNINQLNYKSYQRDMRWDYYLKGIWGMKDDARLGHYNTFYSYARPIPFWRHRFTTVGDAAMVFREGTYFPPEEGKGLPHINSRGEADKTESEVRFDVSCPSMQNVFKYITALNPDNYASNDANETRVRGRININTAPAFVIAQLPWVSSKITGTKLKIADAIVAYRDKLDISLEGGPDYYHGGAIDARQTETGLMETKYKVRTEPGFSSIGELMNVINDSGKEEYDIRYCGIDGDPQFGFPDLYYNKWEGTDSAQDDLEEKEMIFARISDLATVRSDTFTAYILVRVGVDGPQKRFIAILDRTGVKTADDKVKVAAFQQVPAAR